MSVIILCIVLFALSLGVAVVMIVRNRNASKPGVLGGDEDIVDALIDNRRKKLASRPWGMSLKTYFGLSTGGAVVFGLAGYFMSKNILIAVALAVLGLLLPEIVEKLRGERERAKFEERYARALQQIASSVKSGLSIRQAVHEISGNHFIHDSIREEFRQLDSDLQVGLSIHEGFKRFAERVGSDDAADVAIAITLQNQLGGNTGAVIETVTRDIHNRMSNRRETKSLFAGSSSTIRVMDLLPVGIIGFLWLTSPAYLAPFFESFTMKCVFWGLLGFMGIGSVVIRNIVRNMKRDSGA